jgi:hypothetical protein
MFAGWLYVAGVRGLGWAGKKTDRATEPALADGFVRGWLGWWKKRGERLFGQAKPCAQDVVR